MPNAFCIRNDREPQTKKEEKQLLDNVLVALPASYLFSILQGERDSIHAAIDNDLGFIDLEGKQRIAVDLSVQIRERQQQIKALDETIREKKRDADRHEHRTQRAIDDAKDLRNELFTITR